MAKVLTNNWVDHEILVSRAFQTKEHLNKYVLQSSIPSGAKAQTLLSATCGPTKVVPLLQSMAHIGFFRAL
jgi:hypothetical protein